MKYICDLFFSLLLSVLIFPFLIIIAVLIKLTSKGPVFFRQCRIGKDQKEFNILKFRTMYLETPRNVPTHMLEKPEKYITAVGRFLRKTSLDEVPQLFNILKAEMSFVGPRPALYNQYDLIELRQKYGVNCVRPGITGWAQVNGRDEMEISIKVEYDRYYVENWSLLFDLRIILLTFYKVIFAKDIVEGKQETGIDINM